VPHFSFANSFQVPHFLPEYPPYHLCAAPPTYEYPSNSACPSLALRASFLLCSLVFPLHLISSSSLPPQVTSPHPWVLLPSHALLLPHMHLSFPSLLFFQPLTTPQGPLPPTHARPSPPTCAHFLLSTSIFPPNLDSSPSLPLKVPSFQPLHALLHPCVPP
jgi:hypothetical protein